MTRGGRENARFQGQQRNSPYNGDAVRILGAWIGNNFDDVTPWEQILETVQKKFKQWEKVHPTMNGKCLLIQAIAGGHTQFLTKAQGMPE